MTEIYKMINHIAPPMSFLFEIRENTHGFSNESRRTKTYGLEIICCKAPVLWANLPPEYKLAISLNIFKRKIKNRKGENCLCGLCKMYVRQLSYTEYINFWNVFFSFLIQLKKRSMLNRSQKKKFTVIYIMLTPVDFN